MELTTCELQASICQLLRRGVRTLRYVDTILEPPLVPR